MTDWRDAQREHLFSTWGPQRDRAIFEIIDARGARFEVAGKGWVWDLESQVYNVNVGHKHPRVQARMTEQIAALPAAAPNALLPVRAELAQRLAQKTGLDRAFLTTGGSEATENAIKIARLVTGRHKVITRRNSYHGATLAVLSVAGDRRKIPFASHLEPAIHIEDPFPPGPPNPDGRSRWLESLDEILSREGPTSVAAILLEGFTGTNGMQCPPPDFWPGVRERCDAHGILLVDDEIFSGFGRTGRWFAREHWEVEVDMMTIGKGLTSGYAPLAGVMVSEPIARHFDDESLSCGLTHYAHPVSCAAALGSIDVLEDEGLVDNAAAVGRLLGQRLEDIVATNDEVQSTRGLGLMRMLEVEGDAREIAARAWERNLYLPYRDNALFVCPPLCITAEEIAEVADRLREVLRD